MAEDTVYITDLDPILELSPTDSFVVETVEGTARILFKDIILGPDNVSFYEEVAADSLAIAVLSSEVVTLNEDATNINSGLTALSAAYSEAVKSGFCYLTFDSTGTMFIAASSSNIASILVVDSGTNILITTVDSFNFDEASINVTLDSPVSANALSNDFIAFSPIIVAGSRTPNSFKVGINSVLNNFISLSLPTSVNVVSESFSPVTSLTVTPASITPVTSVVPTTTSVMLNPSGTGDVVQSIAVTNLASPVVQSVAPNTTTKTIVNSVGITNTSYNIMVSTNLGGTLALKNNNVNIAFRYL